MLNTILFPRGTKAVIYPFLLDDYLEGIARQGGRIKKNAEMHDKLRGALRGNKKAHTKLIAKQRHLFQEIRVFFWWWGSAYRLLWVGEQRIIEKPHNYSIKLGDYSIGVRKGAKRQQVPALVSIWGNDFSQAIGHHKKRAKAFSKTRNHLEHILERIGAGEGDLGNLSSNSNGERHFSIIGEKINISDSALDTVNELAGDINEWLKKNYSGPPLPPELFVN